MIETILDNLAWVAAVTGSFLIIVGAFGTIRMPDFFTRVHAAGLIDALGTVLILLSLLLTIDEFVAGFKLLLIIIFLLITSPVATHALCKTIRHHKKKPVCLIS